MFNNIILFLSSNRLLEMIYPDEEKVTYSYNLGGLLEKVRGEKSYGYDYITKLGYDKFEQRSYLKYCNGAETFYAYDNRRRLSNLAVNSGNTAIMDNDYTFDAKEYDEETGMYYYGARYYEPRLSLWMSTDVLKEKVPNVSSYAYTENNPITNVDTDGKFRWKWLAQWSRNWHNLWHKNKASEIMENKNAKNPYFRYTYQVGSVENGEFVQTAQDVGDAVSVAGYACTLSVAGAEIGVPLAALGNGISGAFGATEFGIDLINGDFSNGKKSLIYYSAEFLIEKMLGRYCQGMGKN